MRNLILSISILALVLISCEKDESFETITQGDYPVKEYYLERDPKVNVWGAGMNFINSECSLTETDLDYAYLTESDDLDYFSESEDFIYDLIFYTVKAYYYADDGDLEVEGAPAILLSSNTRACKIGEGIDFFDSLSVITEDMIDQLVSEPILDYSLYLNSETGFYDSELLYAAFEECVIGDDFRGTELVIPEGKTEEEVQPVYLIETSENGYVKFMVREFKPDEPNNKQTLVRWQVISE